MQNKNLGNEKSTFLYGLELYFKGDYRSALSVFENVEKDDPAHPLVREFRTKAQKAHEIGVLPDVSIPFDVRKARFKANIFMLKGELDEATSLLLQAAHELKPLGKDSLGIKTDLDELGMLDATKKAFERAKKFADDCNFELAMRTFDENPNLLYLDKAYKLKKNLELALNLEKEIYSQNGTHMDDFESTLKSILELQLKQVFLENFFEKNDRVKKIREELAFRTEDIVQNFLSELPQLIVNIRSSSEFEKPDLSQNVIDQIEIVRGLQPDLVELEIWSTRLEQEDNNTRMQQQYFDSINSFIESENPSDLILAYRLLNLVESFSNDQKYNHFLGKLIDKLILSVRKMIAGTSFMSYGHLKTLRQLLDLAKSISFNDADRLEIKKLVLSIRLQYCKIFGIYLLICIAFFSLLAFFVKFLSL